MQRIQYQKYGGPELMRLEDFELQAMLSGPQDASDAFVKLQAGTGGTEACDWAEMLMRMYTRWSERNKYPVEVFDTSYAEEAGIKSATFAVHAPYAYGTLSVEAGTHRLVRIAPFELSPTPVVVVEPTLLMIEMPLTLASMSPIHV